jgi:hypothetical protein
MRAADNSQRLRSTKLMVIREININLIVICYLDLEHVKKVEKLTLDIKYRITHSHKQHEMI